MTNRSTAHLKFSDQNNHLYCPHDIALVNEFRDDLPTLLVSDTETRTSDSDRVDHGKVKRPDISVFGESKRQTFSPPQIENVKFVSPYSRYLAVLPFAEQQRLEEQQKEIEENRKRKLCPEAFVAPPNVGKQTTVSTQKLVFKKRVKIYFLFTAGGAKVSNSAIEGYG